MNLYPAFGEPNCLIKKREDLSELTGKWSSGTMMGSSQPLMLENEREEIRNPCKKSAKKGEESEAKSAAALKSHSEAEKRRRERINAHLSTLKGLVPTNDKVQVARPYRSITLEVLHKIHGSYDLTYIDEMLK